MVINSGYIRSQINRHTHVKHRTSRTMTFSFDSDHFENQFPEHCWLDHEPLRRLMESRYPPCCKLNSIRRPYHHFFSFLVRIQI